VEFGNKYELKLKLIILEVQMLKLDTDCWVQIFDNVI
jgi:hypothetical protein